MNLSICLPATSIISTLRSSVWSSVDVPYEVEDPWPVQDAVLAVSWISDVAVEMMARAAWAYPP